MNKMQGTTEEHNSGERTGSKLTPPERSGEDDGARTSADSTNAVTAAWMRALDGLEDCSALFIGLAAELRRDAPEETEEAASLTTLGVALRGMALGLAAGPMRERDTVRPSGESDETMPSPEAPADVQPGDVWEETVTREVVRVEADAESPGADGWAPTLVKRRAQGREAMLGDGARKITTPRWRLVSREQPDMVGAALLLEAAGWDALAEECRQSRDPMAIATMLEQGTLMKRTEAEQEALVRLLGIAPRRKLDREQGGRVVKDPGHYSQRIVDRVSAQRRARVAAVVAGYPTDQPLPRAEIAGRLGMSDEELLAALDDLALERAPATPGIDDAGLEAERNSPHERFS